MNIKNMITTNYSLDNENFNDLSSDDSLVFGKVKRVIEAENEIHFKKTVREKLVDFINNNKKKIPMIDVKDKSTTEIIDYIKSLGFKIDVQTKSNYSQLNDTEFLATLEILVIIYERIEVI